ncbi:MAG TPA: hypothetical protein VLB85_03880 [Acidimicrobiia bacterium]|nr:hypothetical protein [Acidimicrobiia bacterium]
MLASRSLAWNEIFARAGMFLTVLSASVVALALVAQASNFGDGFALFALVILPVVLFLGVATTLRLSDAVYHDTLCVVGMNRIRHACIELAPDLQPYFVMSPHDDARGVMATAGIPAQRSSAHLAISSTPQVLGVVNSILAGTIAFIAVRRFGLAATAAGIAAGLMSFISMGLQIRFGMRELAVFRQLGESESIFPSPDDDGSLPG